MDGGRTRRVSLPRPRRRKNYRRPLFYHLLLQPPFFAFDRIRPPPFYAARLLDKLGVGTQECRVRSLLFPLCATAIIIMMAWFAVPSCEGWRLCLGPRAAPPLDLGRVWSASSKRRVSRVFGDWRGHRGVSTAFTSFGREKLTTARRKFGAFPFYFIFLFFIFALCLALYLCTLVWVLFLPFFALHIFTGKSWD